MRRGPPRGAVEAITTVLGSRAARSPTWGQLGRQRRCPGHVLRVPHVGAIVATNDGVRVSHGVVPHVGAVEAIHDRVRDLARCGPPRGGGCLAASVRLSSSAVPPRGAIVAITTVFWSRAARPPRGGSCGDDDGVRVSCGAVPHVGAVVAMTTVFGSYAALHVFARRESEVERRHRDAVARGCGLGIRCSWRAVRGPQTEGSTARSIARDTGAAAVSYAPVDGAAGRNVGECADHDRTSTTTSGRSNDHGYAHRGAKPSYAARSPTRGQLSRPTTVSGSRAARSPTRGQLRR
jgi:hypothetical protein